MKYYSHCAAFEKLSQVFFPSSLWLEAGSEAKHAAGFVKTVGLDKVELGRRLFTAETPWSGFP